MKRRVGLITLLLASLLVIAGCADFSKFGKSPVSVHVKVVDSEGNVVPSQVMLTGPETYGPVPSGADGVATLTSVLPDNYVLAASSGELLAVDTVPVWGGKDLTLTVKAEPVDLGKDSVDINTGIGGSTDREGDDALRIRAGGNDIWGSSDGIRFVYVEVPGDLTIIARAAELKPTHDDGWTKAGVMVRDSLNANSKHISTLITSGNGVQAVRRTQTGGESADVNLKDLNAPIWLKLERVGDTFVSSYSTNGTDWTQVDTREIGMSGTVFVGLALTAHGEGDGLAEVLFDNIQLDL